MPDTLYPGSQYSDPLLFATTAEQITGAIPQGIQLGTQIRQQMLNEEMMRERLAAQQRAEERLLADRRVASIGGGGAPTGGGGVARTQAAPGVAPEHMPALDDVAQLIAGEQEMRRMSEDAIARRGQAFAPQFLMGRQEQADLEELPGQAPVETPAMGIMRRPGEFDPIARELAPEGMPVEDPLGGLLLSPQQAQAQVEAGLLETESTPEERQRYWQQLLGRQRDIGQERQAAADEEARQAAIAAEEARVSRNTVALAETTAGKKMSPEGLQALAAMPQEDMIKLLGKEGEIVKARIGQQGAFARVAESRRAREYEQKAEEERFEREFRAEFQALSNEAKATDPGAFAVVMDGADPGPMTPETQARLDTMRQLLSEAKTEAERRANAGYKPPPVAAGKAPIPEESLATIIENNERIAAEDKQAVFDAAQANPSIAQWVVKGAQGRDLSAIEIAMLRNMGVNVDGLMGAPKGGRVSGALKKAAGAVSDALDRRSAGDSQDNPIVLDNRADALKHPGKWVTVPTADGAGTETIPITDG